MKQILEWRVQAERKADFTAIVGGAAGADRDALN
jgi:hypothetical protein